MISMLTTVAKRSKAVASTLGKRKQLTSIKTKHRNRLNLEPALTLALTKIRPRIEVLTC
jgi:hypothetical protein